MDRKENLCYNAEQIKRIGVIQMPLTDAQRRANDKWDRKNRTMLGCKMYRTKADAFKAAAKAAGTTPNAIFTAAAEAFMQEHGGWDTWMPAASEVEETAGED